MMSNEDYQELHDTRELLRHYVSLFGYTNAAVSKGILEIRERYEKGDTPLKDVMLNRADELEGHLNAIREVSG